MKIVVLSRFFALFALGALQHSDIAFIYFLKALLTTLKLENDIGDQSEISTYKQRSGSRNAVLNSFSRMAQ